MAKNDDKQVRCSFCGKREGQVKRLIAGPGVFICDECIDLCCDILHDDYLETEMEDMLGDAGEKDMSLFLHCLIAKQAKYGGAIGFFYHILCFFSSDT